MSDVAYFLWLALKGEVLGLIYTLSETKKEIDDRHLLKTESNVKGQNKNNNPKHKWKNVL